MNESALFNEGNTKQYNTDKPVPLVDKLVAWLNIVDLTFNQTLAGNREAALVCMRNNFQLRIFAII